MNNAYQERNQSNPDLTRRQIKVEFGQDTNQKVNIWTRAYHDHTY